MTDVEIRRLKDLISKFTKAIAKSPLGNVELEPEPAIRDFIVDHMLTGTDLAAGFHAVVEVSGSGGWSRSNVWSW